MSTAGTAPAKEEISFYSDNSGVRVTNTRLIIGSTTYAMLNITSVSRAETPPSRVGPVMFLLVGTLSFLGGLSGGSNITIFGVFMMAIGAFWWKTQKTKYHLVIASASGEAKAITSEDKQRVDKIVSAVNESIIGRG
jgi:hypothetical protein